jgi:hypothetical protein
MLVTFPKRVTLENQIRGLAVVFGVPLRRALIAAFVDKALKASSGIRRLRASSVTSGSKSTMPCRCLSSRTLKGCATPVRYTLTHFQES